MKLAILHTRLSGHTASCLRAFRLQYKGDVLGFAWPMGRDAPFSDDVLAGAGDIRSRSNCSNADLVGAVAGFHPDAILVSGWIDRGYVRVCRHFKRQGVPVISGCDNQWQGTLRQRLAALTAPIYVRRFIDVLWVPGDRQRRFARALGFRGTRCWEGFYSCDRARFAATADTPRLGAPSFLFVGRYVEEKGVRDLAQAYSIYRDAVPDPWKLVCAGTGPLADVVRACGADDRGFVQPHELPALMHSASALVLPSRFERWGVVIHEAATAGLPLIVSTACGAGDHLVRNESNGFLIRSGSVDDLVRTLLRMHHASAADRRRFGDVSRELSSRYTPERWARTLVDGVKQLKAKFST